MSDQKIQVIIQNHKDPMVGAALAFFFGCLGMFYSTPKGALIMLLPTIISAALTPFLIGFPMLFVCNVITCVWSYKACEAHNKSLVQDSQQVAPSKAA